MTRTTFPVLEHIGTLVPPSALLAQVLGPSFQLAEFDQSADYPVELLAFLTTRGYEPDDYGAGLLFASTHGVTLHTDEHPSVLWVLGGSFNKHQTSHQLIVGNQAQALAIGDVLLFDARKLHGLIAGEPGLWAIFSCYVRRIAAPRKKRAEIKEFST